MADSGVTGFSPVGGQAQGQFEQLVSEYSGSVLRLAYRLTGNRYDAEDLRQEVFLRVMKKLDGLIVDNVGAWLNRVTTNLFLDQARRKSRVRLDALAGGEDTKLTALRSAHVLTPGPERSYELNHLDADIVRALHELNAEQRAVIVLSDLEGLSYDEVASALGVKLGTVRSRIHRARALLREKLRHREPRRRPSLLPATHLAHRALGLFTLGAIGAS